MKKENKNVVVVYCPPCGENALQGKKGVFDKRKPFLQPPYPPAAYFPHKGGR